MRTILQISLVLAVWLPHSSAVDFNPITHCPTRLFCHCQPTTIECLKRGLPEVPTFNKTNWQFETLQLALNAITTLKNYAFLHVNVSEIYLNDNQIATIEPDAFNGLQGQLKVLDLGGNNLVQLPDVIGKLSGLNVLDVSHNPMPVSGFNDKVMREIGDFVHEFRFGSPSLESWPQSLHHLQALNVLKFYGGANNFTTVPIWAFSSFEFTLRKLWIQNTSLIAVPVALQYLTSINELHFDNNQNVGDAGILIPAFAGLSHTLRNLSLENNNLTTFPSVLLTLQNVTSLSLAGNSLEFVSDQAVGLVTSDLQTLNLQNCNLDRIPGALSKLPSVTDLDISFNHITTIEKNDLQHMANLRKVDVSNNPLRYVSKSTFHDLKKLDSLILKNTDLYNVPEALKNIPALKTLSLWSGSPSIECNCDLAWLYCYLQSNTQLQIEGQCETVDLKIDEYVAQKIHDVCSPVC